MNEAVVFSQPLDLLVISGSGLKVGVVSQKIPARKKNPPFKILDPPLKTVLQRLQSTSSTSLLSSEKVGGATRMATSGQGICIVVSYPSTLQSMFTCSY